MGHCFLTIEEEFRSEVTMAWTRAMEVAVGRNGRTVDVPQRQSYNIHS